jgi:hypothetical protein
MATECSPAPADFRVAPHPIGKGLAAMQDGTRVATTIVASGPVAEAAGTTISAVNHDDGLADVTAPSSLADAAFHEGNTDLNVPDHIAADIPNVFLLTALSHENSDLDLYDHHEDQQVYSDSGSEYDPEAGSSRSVVKTSKAKEQNSPATFKKTLTTIDDDVFESSATDFAVATRAPKNPASRVRDGRVAGLWADISRQKPTAGTVASSQILCNYGKPRQGPI